ncbi:Clp protease ClpP [Paenarthrobacter sp. PAE-2]|uniref:head maturation protease, ClpP-related n=1 Tax=Paenarthrobacter sp. PAE-2 TaxID=2982532 RepID=UPI00223097F1|nr:head maturation protease, ClpP-related [Paenarthrobacter sp. PAE-2]MCW3766462.1 Clp protease ClpP [Paenarthrobacter sp. PAE-2]
MTHPLRPANTNRQPWYRMEAQSGSTADVFIYDAIDSWYGVDAAQFVQDIAALDVETINLYVNSPGGSVFDGVAIMNALRRHKAQVVATVDGLAASAASFIVQAADEVVMGFGSEMMIHDASAICWGNAAEMTETASILDQLSSTIAGIYAERAGGTADEWRDAMRAETWYSAEEAVAAGLADRVEARNRDESKDGTESSNSRFDLTVFAHAGRRNAPAPATATANHERRPNLRLVDGSALATAVHMAAKATPTPPAEPKDITNPQEEGTDTMSEALTQGLRERLGIPAAADLDENGLLAALDEALAEQEPAPAAQAAPGTVLLDADQYEALRNDANQGREAREQQLADSRASLVTAAVNDGRISPARREHWMNTLEADPGMAETLAKLEKGLVPLEAKGYVGGVDEASDEDQLYSKFYPGKEG